MLKFHPSNALPDKVLVFHLNGQLIIELFEKFRLRPDVDYTYIKVYGEDTPSRVLSLISPGRPQLVFLPHVADLYDIADLVRRIKAANAQSVVITLGFSDDPIVLPEGLFIDGVVNLNSPGELTRSLPSAITLAFQQGHPREDLVAMTKSVKK